MSEGLKARFDFPSPIIQAQTVRTLVAAVLKEKAPNERISSQGAAMGALWEQCCSDCAPVRSACCDALVLLVEQGHADLQHIMETILNLMPSARNVQGLIKVTGRLLQMQADQRDTGAPYTCPYSIRGSPHPYITALENRVDCWPVLLLEVEDYVQEAVDRDEPVYVDMLEPFLRYLYCQPQRHAQQALLRHGLLRVLLPAWGAGGGGGGEGEESPPPSPRVSERLLRCLYHMVPHMQVDSVEAVLELHGFLQTLLPAVVRAPGRGWRAEGARLALQLLCACHVSLRLDGSCGPPVSLLRQLLPACKEELPVEELLVGLSLLLLEASAPQQTSLLTLALSLVPEDSERCPWGTPVLMLPLLQTLACSALTEPLADPRTHRRNHGLAHSLLRSAQKPTQSYTGGGVCLSSPLSGWYSEVQVVVHVLRRVLGSASAASDWLLSVISSLTSSSGGSPPRPPAALGLVVAHLIVGGPPDVCRLALRAAQAIGVADPSQVPSLLPVLLFRLGKESDPSVCHALLSSLPHLGTHKLCVPQVLHILQMLASDPKLRAVAMRLMTTLWVKQDRVYPDLQRVMLGQQEKWSVVLGKDTQWELILARAACIRDICTERPYQHGGDMLAAIAHTLSQNTKPDLASPAALALQGLTQLCRAEVVDMVSTWRALGPKLSGDRRPLVVKAVSELLALVHQLTTKSQDYQKLKEEIVSFLWSYALSKECEVSSCGYRALSSFPEDSHTVLHLPEPARPVKLPTDEEEEEEEEGKEKEEEDLSVPGLSYVKLLTLTPSPVLPALEVLVTSLVRQEMERMPRGVYHSALRGANLRSDQGKTLAGVPAFMLKTYEKNKQPGLKPGLAAGLLLSYDLPVQTDRDGRSLPRFLLARSRSFQQTLTALIHEVNIQPSEWHRALLLPQAWRAFMNRAFHAVLQGRRGELEMQQKQGKGSPEDLQYKHHCAWLCARDQLTDVLKSAAKDSPVVQGNSILALSGLAAVVAKYESNLPLDPDGSLGVGPEVLPTSSWLSMVLDTLLSVINSSYKARGQVFPWFIHRSYSGENMASTIARSCAALALCLVVPVLSGWHREGVSEVLATLRAGLPGQPTADDSQAVQFHSGLALGMVLSAMHRERLSEVSAQKDADLLTTSLDSLESCSFDPSLEYNAGCVLGIGLVLGSLSSSGQSEHGVRVVLTLDKLLVSLRDSSGQGRMLQEVLSYSVACVVVSAFRGGLVDAGKAEEVMNTLRGLTEDNQQTPGFSLSLGLVVHGLAACGHGKAEDIHPRLLAAWVKILLAEGCPTMQRLAAVNGLVALVGSESYVIQLKTETELSSQQQGRLNEVIRSMTQIISFSGAIGLQSNSSCLVGHLHLAHMTCSHSHTAVPQDFSYLPEKSLIRAIIQYVSEAGKKGPECTRPAVVRVSLACLASVGSTFQYPPVNWSAILSPLMRLNFGQDTQHQCAVLAASQVQTSQSASLFLGSWLSPPLVHSLSYETRGRLYEGLSTWMKHVSEDKLQVFVESQGAALFQEDIRAQRRSLCLALLRGLAQAMALPNPPSTVWAVLRSTTEKIFSLLPDRIQDSDVELFEGITKCLSELPDTEIDRITQVTQTNMKKSCLVLTFLTSRGRVPLLGLNDVIAAVLRGWPSQGVGGLLPHTFYQCRLAPSGPNTGVSKRMEWLLELMGHIRNIVYGATSVQCSIRQATDFLLQVFAGAVAAWGDHSMPLLLGMRANWFPWEEEEEEKEEEAGGGSKPPCLPHRPYGEENLTTKTPLLSPTGEETHLSVCLLGLSHSLPQLLSKEPWSSQLSKFIDWLFSLVESPEDCWSAASISTVRAALLSLRSCAEFQKKAVWTRAYGW